MSDSHMPRAGTDWVGISAWFGLDAWRGAIVGVLTDASKSMAAGDEQWLSAEGEVLSTQQDQSPTLSHAPTSPISLSSDPHQVTHSPVTAVNALFTHNTALVASTHTTITHP